MYWKVIKFVNTDKALAKDEWADRFGSLEEAKETVAIDRIEEKGKDSNIDLDYFIYGVNDESEEIHG